MNGDMKFRTKGKLIPRYIGPYRMSKRVDNVDYVLELPQDLKGFIRYSIFQC